MKVIRTDTILDVRPPCLITADETPKQVQAYKQSLITPKQTVHFAAMVVKSKSDDPCGPPKIGRSCLPCPHGWNEYIPKKNRHSESVQE